MESTHAPASHNRQPAPHMPDKAMTALGATIVGVGLGFSVWGVIICGAAGLVVGTVAEKNHAKNNRQ